MNENAIIPLAGAVTPAQAQIQMTKTISTNSGVIKGGEFTFNMYSNGQLIATAKNDAEGRIIFPPVTIDHVGNMDYEIFEVPDFPPKPGWTYDSHQCTANVQVTEDPITHALIAKVTYSPAVSPNFVNHYYNPEIPVTIQNKVIGHGKNISSGEFVFDIVDDSGNVIAQAKNDSEGNIVFPEINLPGGDYNYKIIPPENGGGWTFDKPEIPVKVHIADNGNGTLTPTVTYPADPDFNATYKPTPASTGELGAPHAAKVIYGGGQLSAGQFSFGLYDKDNNLVSEVTNADDGTVFFPALTFENAGQYDYTIKETSPDGGGWTGDRRSFPYRVTVTDNGEGELKAADSYPNGTPRFINIYRAAPAKTSSEQTPKGVKTVNGGTLESGQFNFGIYDNSGNLIESATNDSNGNIEFVPLTFNSAGEYNYTIRESTPDGAGYTTDKTTYPLKITVTDDGKGQLQVTVDPPLPRYTFTNTYMAKGSESILAYKSISGWNNTEAPPEFSFSLREKDGTVVKTAVSKDGTIDFGTIDYTSAGDYEYTISESVPLPAGWTAEDSSFRVLVHMEDDGAGNLIASVTYPDSGTSPKFVNTYRSRPANVGNVITNNPSGKNPIKTMIGNKKPVKDSYFNFGLYDKNNNLVALGFSDPAGKIRFPIFFVSNLGHSAYTMKEINVDDRGWTTDRTEYPVDVNVKDNGQGLRLAEVTYPSGTPNFVNTYKASDAEADVAAKVIGHGGSISDGQFEFDLVDGKGNIVGKAKNDENGNIIFPSLNLPDGDYNYKIVPPKDGGGWRFDVPSLPVFIHITDNGDGTSSADVSYPTGSVFNPTYPPEAANVGDAINSYPGGAIPHKKTVGFVVSENQFSFGIYDSDNKLVAVGLNDADGKIIFKNFYSTALGETDYTMKELTVDGNGYVTDKRSYPIKINITDPGTGRLAAAVSYPDGVPEFINTRIVPEGVVVIPKATKILNGAVLAAGGFSFGLFDESGKEIAVSKNDENGDVIFPYLTFSEPGVYNFTVKELAVSGNGWKIDDSIHTVTVTVTENASYQLMADITYDGGNTPPEFVNSFISESKSVTVKITANKIVCGACYTENQFSFELISDSGETLQTVSNDADGKINFTPLTFTSPGVYSYKLKENDPHCCGWCYDDRIISVVVTIREDDSGELTAEVTYNGEGKPPVFVNTFVC